MAAQTETPAPPSLSVDLTGLPADVFTRVLAIVDEARRQQAKAAGVPVTEPDENGRLPLMGRYAHLGWNFPPEDFAETRREMAAGFRDRLEQESP